MLREANNKVFYHIQKNRKKDDRWEVGNDFVIDDDYKSFSNYYLEYIPDIKYKDLGLDDACRKALDGEYNKEELSELGNMIIRYTFVQPTLLREYVLENIRRLEFPNLISRANCLYLTNKKSLEYWKDIFSDIETTTFQVEVNGIYFCSHACLLPEKNRNILTQEWQARQYWKNNLKANKNAIKNDMEYLFKGKVKVLKKL